MYWPEELIKRINEEVDEPYKVDDMKTPSGQVHMGSLRGVVIHDVVHKELLKEKKESRYTYIYNDMDPMNKVPVYLSDKGYEEDLGKPLFSIKSPDDKSPNYARYYADIFTNTFNIMGATPEILYSSVMYQEGKFNDVIQESLDKVAEIRNIYTDVAGYSKPDSWYPLQVICPECGKIGTTLVTGWDGKEVGFECKKDLVKWAVGCGTTGKISPFDGNAKLMWKVDWPAHWKVLGINVEGAGKDHSSAGGSRDMAAEICKVLNISNPFDIPYEWFLTKGGGKMSTSKGVGMYAKDLLTILPPEVARFLILRTHYNTAILFEPNEDTIPDLFDEFDRCAKAYYSTSEKDAELAKYFEASIIRDFFEVEKFLPRFRSLSMYIQMPSLDIYEWAKNEKGSKLNKEEVEILEERIKYAKSWLSDYAPEKYKFMYKEEIPEEVKELTSDQITYLKSIITMLESNSEDEGDKLQEKLFQITKDLDVKSSVAFKSIYLSLIGKDSGPKAGWLVKDVGINKVISRFKEICK